MGAQRNLLHSLTISVRWGDMDILGHVNNAAYFTYMEQARVSWLAGLGVDRLGTGDTHGPVIVTAACTFHKAITYPAVLQVQMYGGSPGRSSFNAEYELRGADHSDTLYAAGSTRIVWVDYRTGRSEPLPEFIRRRLPLPG